MSISAANLYDCSDLNLFCIILLQQDRRKIYHKKEKANFTSADWK